MRERTKCEIYSRVVGYLSPIMRWNKGKVAEWKNREVFKLKEEDEREIQVEQK